jgi:hypothetical protein
MDLPYPLMRLKVGLLLLLGLTLAASLNLLYQNGKAYPDFLKTDPVTIHETRINQIKGALPGTAAVGYVTAVDNEKIFYYERSLSNVEFLAQYILTQYTLAPVIVYNSPDYPLVVGNYIDGSPDHGFLKRKALIPVRDFGDGLILYQKEPKP